MLLPLGAELICGGKRLGSKGYYIEQTIFANVKDEMRIAREEIFGPVQSIFRFEDEDEVCEGALTGDACLTSAFQVIRRANDTTYGLAASVLSNNVDTINKLSRSIRAGERTVSWHRGCPGAVGMFWANCYLIFDNATPLGGYKMSGIGRENAEYGLRELTEVISYGLSSPAESLWKTVGQNRHDAAGEFPVAVEHRSMHFAPFNDVRLMTKMSA